MVTRHNASLPSGLLNDWSVWLGYGLFWNWLWFLFVKPLGATMGATESAILLDDRYITMAAALVSFLLVCLLSNRINTVIRIATASFAIATAISFIPNVPLAIIQPVENICSGALAALLFVAWNMLIARYDSGRVIRVTSLALASASLCAIAIFLLDASKQDLLLALVPLCSIAFLLPQIRKSPEGSPLTSKTASEPKPVKNERGKGHSKTRRGATSFKYMPWRLLCTVFLQGSAIGLWHFIFHSVTIIKCSAEFCIWREVYGLFGALGFLDFVGFASIFGFFLAFALLVLTAYFLHLNYRRLIYQIGIPFIALAFIVISFHGGIVTKNDAQMTGDLFVIGEILYTTGYFYVFAIVQTLCSHLIAGKEPREVYFFSTVGFLLLAGQAVGYLAGLGGSLLEISGTDMCMLAVFAILLGSLILIKGNPIWEDIGDAKPTAATFPRKGAFRIACDEIAVETKLTPREIEVFLLLAHGRNLGIIQEQLVISRDTAKSHLRNIYRKLDVHSQQDLMSMVDARADYLRKTHPPTT